MKKPVKPIKSKTTKSVTKPSKVEEPLVGYKSIKALPTLKDFSYNEFKKIANKAPFTQAEWASVLHISERTLQRYAKSNGTFAPINAERALQIAHVLEQGKITFGTEEKFYSWLKNNPSMLEGTISFNTLSSHEGIQLVLTQLGRIQHGILA